MLRNSAVVFLFCLNLQITSLEIYYVESVEAMWKPVLMLKLTLMLSVFIPIILSYSSIKLGF